jgi:hypothetical protein
VVAVCDIPGPWTRVIIRTLKNHGRALRSLRRSIQPPVLGSVDFTRMAIFHHLRRLPNRGRSIRGLAEATLLTKTYVTAAISAGHPHGGTGPVHHLYRMNQQRRGASSGRET